MKTPMNQIGLGAIINLFDGPYCSCTVVDVSAGGDLTLYRPYVQTSDFTTSGKAKGSTAVIPYIGTETIVIMYRDNYELDVVRPGPEDLQ